MNKFQVPDNAPVSHIAFDDDIDLSDRDLKGDVAIYKVRILAHCT